MASRVLYLGSDARTMPCLHALRRAGLDTVRVRSGREALSLCRAEHLLVTVFAPGEMRRGALRLVEELSREGTAVIVIADVDWGRLAVRHGAWEYLIGERGCERDLPRHVLRALAFRHLQPGVAPHVESPARPPLVADEMIVALAHEITNPLTAILGYAQMLAEADALDESVSEIGERLAANAEKVLALVRDIFETMRAQSGHLSLACVPADFNRIVGSAVQEVERRKGRRIEFQPAARLPAVAVDPPRVARLIEGLLAGAVAETPASGSVDVATQAEAGFVTLCISTRGASTQPNLAAALRSETPTAQLVRHELARLLVAAHGGTVTVRSAPARITMQLPIAEARLAVGS